MIQGNKHYKKMEYIEKKSLLCIDKIWKFFVMFIPVDHTK